tara:strand:+ start:11756 stop:12112 length:357 start_codon:yes stop_codon:yes gene_type:complete
MIHVMEDEWAVLDIDTIIDCADVYSWVYYKRLTPQPVMIKDVGHKPTTSIKKEDARYLNAKLSLPGVVVKNMDNPDGKPYRMIDGRHRLLKAQNSGRTSMLVYVLNQEQILKFIKPYK